MNNLYTRIWADPNSQTINILSTLKYLEDFEKLRNNINNFFKVYNTNWLIRAASFPISWACFTHRIWWELKARIWIMMRTALMTFITESWRKVQAYHQWKKKINPPKINFYKPIISQTTHNHFCWMTLCQSSCNSNNRFLIEGIWTGCRRQVYRIKEN